MQLCDGDAVGSGPVLLLRDGAVVRQYGGHMQLHCYTARAHAAPLLHAPRGGAVSRRHTGRARAPRQTARLPQLPLLARHPPADQARQAPKCSKRSKYSKYSQYSSFS